ncbi:C-type lectin domain family 4 member M-like [Megalobrama amblycephala]|uniref:C-type lectin domain family 4 member M-like n=1 Tax=Megalobrama amblycephala TaxID=75352 RepID=UPI002013CBD5|nr:C-type lectin domain family 4 member M-like [Megalobrama amblycephala]
MTTDNIYENADAIRGEITEDTGHSRTTRLQPPELTGSGCVRIRCSRAAAVCLVLLCVLLLTAAIVRCVMFTQERKQLIQERDQLLIKITNFTEEKDHVLFKFTNITKEKDQLLTKITSITEERDQLLTKITNLTEENDQQLSKITSITEERDHLLTKITNLTEENDQQLSKISSITEEKDQLLTKISSITEEKDQLLTKISSITEEKDQLLTKISSITEEKDQLLTKIANLTEENEQQLSKITSITEEKDQLLTKITSITEERDQLLTKITNLTEENDQQLSKITSITEERDHLLTKIANLTEENDQQLSKITSIREEKDQLLTKITNQTEERIQLIIELLSVRNNELIVKLVVLTDGWIYNQSSLYFISSEKKNWIESRRYCTERGADLIIVNNRKEQVRVKTHLSRRLSTCCPPHQPNDCAGEPQVTEKENVIINWNSMRYRSQHVVKNMIASGMIHVSYYGFWIGLTDSDVEGRWKWVDGTNMTYEFWWSGQPDNYNDEDCAMTSSAGWNDYPCSGVLGWICEKIVFK